MEPCSRRKLLFFLLVTLLLCLVLPRRAQAESLEFPTLPCDDVSDQTYATAQDITQMSEEGNIDESTLIVPLAATRCGADTWMWYNGSIIIRGGTPVDLSFSYDCSSSTYAYLALHFNDGIIPEYICINSVSAEMNTKYSCKSGEKDEKATECPGASSPNNSTVQPDSSTSTTTTTTTTTTTEAPDPADTTSTSTSVAPNTTTSTTTTTTSTTSTTTAPSTSSTTTTTKRPSPPTTTTTTSTTTTTAAPPPASKKKGLAGWAIAVIVIVIIVVVAVVVVVLVLYFVFGYFRRSRDASSSDGESETSSGTEASSSSDKDTYERSFTSCTDLPSFTDQTNHQLTHGCRDALHALARKKSVAALMRHGMDEDQGLRLHLLRHRGTADSIFGRFVDSDSD